MTELDDRPPPSDDPATRRREEMLAFHLGALLDPDAEALIRGRLESDPDWQSASMEAQAMLKGLTQDANLDLKVPEDLGARAVKRMREAREAALPRKISKTDAPNTPVALPFAFNFRIAAAVLLLAAIPIYGYAIYYSVSSTRTESMRWEAESGISAGTPYVPNLIMRDAVTGKPLAGITVKASLQPEHKASSPIEIGTAQTGSSGMLEAAAWKIPDVPAGPYKVCIEARTPSGQLVDRVEQAVRIVSAARLVLSPDRLRARPGESVRVRALMVSGNLSKPEGGKAISLDLLDSLGNRIAHQESSTSAFGLAWAEFPLDSEATEGDYTLRAESEGLKAEQKVQVLQYRLPPYKVTLTPERPWFRPGESVSGKIDALTFDGHPVIKAQVDVKLLNDSGKLVAEAKGLSTDAQGQVSFSIKPEVALQLGNAQTLHLNALVVDPANRAVDCAAELTLSNGPAIVHALPEAGELVSGVENYVYLVLRTPDGKPLQSRLKVERAGLSGKTALAQPELPDALGVTRIALSDPQSPAEVLSIQIPELSAEPIKLSLPVRASEDLRNAGAPAGQLLVRTDHAVLLAGEKLGVTVLSGDLSDYTASLALKQNGQTVAITAAQLKSGRAEAFIMVPQLAPGVLELEATLQRTNGHVWMDRRPFRVEGGSNLHLAAQVDRGALPYKPGEHARLDFHLTDAAGAGIPGAVSIVGVDSALVALTGTHPGLAQALQVAGLNILHAGTGLPDPAAVTAKESASDAAHAAFAGALLPKVEAPRGKTIDTLESRRSAREAQLTALRDQRPAWIFLTVPALLALWVLYSACGKREGYRGEALSAARAAVPILTLSFLAFGLFGAAVLHSSSHGVLLLVLTMLLFLSHSVLILRCLKLAPGSQIGLNLVTVPIDIALVICAAMASSDPHSGLMLLLAVGGLIFQAAFFFESVGNAGIFTPGKVALACLGLFLIAGVLLPTLGRTQYSSKHAALEERAQAAPSISIDMPTKIPDLSAAPMPVIAAQTPLGFSNSYDVKAALPRLRYDFRETLVFAPELVTDASGHASLDIPLADALTTWQVKADAIGAEGGTATTLSSITVTQPLSVELTLPANVTASDTLVVSAVVSNHTDRELLVDLALDLSGATPLDGLTRKQSVPAKGLAAADFRVRFEQPGSARFHLVARAGSESDAIEQHVPVLPDGRPEAFGASALLSDKGELEVRVPENALPGAAHGRLTIHRGPLAQMLEGLESMLQEPHGCFEQTSSTNYPNIMVLRYLKTHNATKPEVERRAHDLLARGYQRLLTFEVGGRSGSFSLFGQAPASIWLTAYGLMQFQDLAQVYPVDDALIARMRTWLSSKMASSGSFPLDKHYTHGSAALGLAGTAYVLWALGDSAPEEGLRYLRAHRAEIESDAYTCALAALALAPHDRATAGALAGRLRSLVHNDQGGADGGYLDCNETMAWGHGQNARIEATALGILALLETGVDLDLAKRLLSFIQRNGSAGGGWGSTQATVLALKALEHTAALVQSAGQARIVAELNGKVFDPIDLPAGESAAAVSIPLDLPTGVSKLKLNISGGPMAVRVSGVCFVPWNASATTNMGSIRASIVYASKSLVCGQAVLGTLDLRATRRVEVPMAEWELPAGFTPDTEDLDQLKKQGVLTRWERSGRVLRLYFPDLEAGKAVTVPVRFYATAKGELKSAVSKVYEYYRRDEATVIEPTAFRVE